MGDLTSTQQNGNMLSAAVGFGTAAIAGAKNFKQEQEQALLDEANRDVQNQRLVDSLMSTYRQKEDEADQLRENNISASIDSQIVEAKAKGAIESEAGASGVGGSGTSMQMDDIEVQTDMNSARATLNTQRQLTSLRTEATSAHKQTEQMYDIMPIQQPSQLASLMQTGMTGFRNTISLMEMSNSMYGASKADK